MVVAPILLSFYVDCHKVRIFKTNFDVIAAFCEESMNIGLYEE